MRIPFAVLAISLFASQTGYIYEAARTDCDFSTVESALEGAAIGSKIITSVPSNGDTTCDFYAMGWNNFLYLASEDKQQNSPQMLGYAPWYYFNYEYNGGAVTPYPTGKAELNPDEIGKFMGQAGDGWDLKTVHNQPVVYDVRMNKPMYDAIVEQSAYKPEVMQLNTGTSENPVDDGSLCTQEDSCPGNLKLTYPPMEAASTDPKVLAKQKAEEGAIEYKSAWVDFGSAKKCPSRELFCEGQFGLVGFHLAQKTIEHGEWIWWSFEYIGNSPDCEPTVAVGENEQSFASLNPIGRRKHWMFFDHKKWKADQRNNVSSKRCDVPTIEQPFIHGGATMTADICSGKTTSPETRGLCNQNPLIDLLKDTSDNSNYMPVNVCRTDSLPQAKAIRKAGLCALGGDNSIQAAQMTCLNDDVASGSLSIEPSVAPQWMKNYIQIGSIWTKPGVSPEPAFYRGNVQLSFEGGDDDYVRKGFVHLANTSLETWMQKGAHTPYCNASDNNAPSTWEELDCLTCHKPTYVKPTPDSPVVPELPKDGRIDTSHLLERVLESNEEYLKANAK